MIQATEIWLMRCCCGQAAFAVLPEWDTEVLAEEL
jgi:hypothetical protein